MSAATVWRLCRSIYADEAFSGHPLAERGLQPYSTFEVLDSSWIRGLMKRNERLLPLGHEAAGDEAIVRIALQQLGLLLEVRNIGPQQLAQLYGCHGVPRSETLADQ